MSIQVGTKRYLHAPQKPQERDDAITEDDPLTSAAQGLVSETSSQNAVFSSILLIGLEAHDETHWHDHTDGRACRHYFSMTWTGKQMSNANVTNPHIVSSHIMHVLSPPSPVL